MTRPSVLLFSVFTLSSLASCQSDERTPIATGFRIEVAPLGVETNSNICWDLEVSSSNGVVWQRGSRAVTFAGGDQSPNDEVTPSGPDVDTICSTQYGSGALGGVTFVGACDATGDTDPDTAGVQNDIRLWVDGVYPGSTPPDGSPIPAERYGWEDPCPNGCLIKATCLENADTPVEFNIALLRQLDNAFIVATLNSGGRIYCAASFSTCDGTEPKLLLSGRDATPDPTAVLAINCQVEPLAPPPEFFFNTPVINCTDSDPVTPDSTFELAMTCGDGTAGSTSAGTQLEYSVSNEGLPSGCGSGGTACESADGIVALNLSTLPPGKACTLTIDATVAEQGVFSNGTPPANTSLYPYIILTTELTDSSGQLLCKQHGLNQAGSPLDLIYRGPIAEPEDQIVPMCVRFDAGDTAMVDTGACPAVACEEFIRQSCTDGVKNGTESDIDCGGTCGPCGAGDSCVSGPDCISGSCLQDTFECAPDAIPAGLVHGIIVEPDGWYRLWADGTFAADCSAYRNGDGTHQYAGQTGSGRYRIKPNPGGAPFDVYCDMTSSGGGWTLVMKLDGNDTTFLYDSLYWTTPAVYHSDAIWLDEDELKSEAFNVVAFSEVRLGMKTGNVTNWLDMTVPPAPSLLALFSNSTQTSTALGREAWKSLIPDASLQSNCGLEGFNVTCAPGGDPTRVRIGIVGNEQNDCSSCDSRLGFGGASSAGGQDPTNSCGNEALSSADNGDKSIRSFGYVFVRTPAVGP